MWSLIIKIVSLIFSLTGLTFLAKLFGENKAKQQQQKIEIEDSNENAKINKQVGSMSFDDKSEFLLSKQKRKRD